MELDLRDKVVIVNGASRGIGLEIARGFAEEGARLALCARDGAQLEGASRKIEDRGVEVLRMSADVTNAEDMEQFVESTFEQFGRIDVLVHNAGGGGGGGVEDSSDEDWSDAFALNATAAARSARLVVPHMKGQGGGAIVFVASIWGRESGGRAPYNAAKSAEISMAKSFGRELAADGIRVNSVAPGSIWFPGGSWDRRQKEDPEEIAEFVRREIPGHRFGRPDEVADVVVFLASERASWIRGACIPIDGGQSRSNI